MEPVSSNPQAQPTADGSLSVFSPRYGEWYASRHGAARQSRTVFLEGSAAHLHPAPRVLEVGFGLGLNFRTTLADAAGRGAALDYLAFEAFPLAASVLRGVSAGEEDALWLALLDAWDAGAAAGELSVSDGQATLRIVFADVSAADLPLGWASAVYLDGFSPARNPEVWTPQMLGPAVGQSRAGWTAGDLQRGGRGAARFDRGGPDGGAAAGPGCRAGGQARVSGGPKAVKHLLIVGGGVAGASAAYFAARSGWAVTLLDAGESRASDVPAALLNPVRGQSGKVEPLSLAGLRFTFALIRELEAAGHAVPHHQTGVLRPVPDEKTRRKWEANLPAELPHRWRDPAGLPPGWHSVLDIPEGGWVSGAALVRSLVAASGARVVRGRAATVTASGAVLEGGEILWADRVLCCGGSSGSEGGIHRAGSLLLLDSAPVQPLSFGAYLSPAIRGGVLGATFEAPAASHAAALALGLPLKSLDWLLGKGAALS